MTFPFPDPGSWNKRGQFGKASYIPHPLFKGIGEGGKGKEKGVWVDYG